MEGESRKGLDPQLRLPELPSRDLSSARPLVLDHDRPRSLRHDLSSVELYEHRRIGFEIFNGYGETKVVQQEELELEMIQLSKRQTPDLCRYR